jgi:hypothetical protein
VPGVRHQLLGNLAELGRIVLDQRDQPGDGTRISVAGTFDEVGHIVDPPP